jgi:TonB family protein
MRTELLAVAITTIVLSGVAGAERAKPVPARTCADVKAWLDVDGTITQESFKQLMTTMGYKWNPIAEENFANECKLAARKVTVNKHQQLWPTGIGFSAKVVDDKGICRLADVSLDQCGLPEDLRHRAEGGDVNAMVELGYAIFLGRGEAQNDAEALKWFLRAAGLGDAEAMEDVGVAFAEGRGVPEDHAEARVWFNRAKQAGQLGATYWIKILDQRDKKQPVASLQPIDTVAMVLGSDGKPVRPLQWVEPKLIGKPHVCDDYYPRGIAADAVTGLQFRITPQGDVAYVSMIHSSGLKELDGAASACISSWKYRPTVSNGAGVAVRALVVIPWRAAMAPKPTPAQMNWAADHPTAVSPLAKGKPHICGAIYPKDTMQAGIQGRASIAFTITAEGTTKDVHVTRSSGNEMLDDASVKCAKEWQYTQPMEHGKPVEIPWAADVDWSLH